MFMYSDYILQHTQAQIFWRLVHGKVATLKVIMFHYSGNGRAGFPGASGSITQLLFCEHTNTCFTLMSRFVRMFMKTVPILWGVWMTIIAYRLPVFVFCVSSLFICISHKLIEFATPVKSIVLLLWAAKQVFCMQIYSSVKKGLSFPHFFLFFGKNKQF